MIGNQRIDRLDQTVLRARARQRDGDFGPAIGVDPVAQLCEVLLGRFEGFERFPTRFRIGIGVETLFEREQRVGRDREAVVEEEGRQKRDAQLKVSRKGGRDGRRAREIGNG